jgi:hypothetical protein
MSLHLDQNFQQIEVKWKFIDHSKFSTTEDDEIVSSLLQDIKKDVIAFADNQLQSGNFRDYYKNSWSFQYFSLQPIYLTTSSNS